MAHFAEIDPTTNVVLRVVVCDTKEWCEKRLGGKWVHTYYSSEQKNYAGIGYIYYPEQDNFSPPQPYPSWILNDAFAWEAPHPYPHDDKTYTWDENQTNWVEICCDGCYGGGECDNDA